MGMNLIEKVDKAILKNAELNFKIISEVPDFKTFIKNYEESICKLYGRNVGHEYSDGVWRQNGKLFIPYQLFFSEGNEEEILNSDCVYIPKEVVDKLSCNLEIKDNVKIIDEQGHPTALDIFVNYKCSKELDFYIAVNYPKDKKRGANQNRKREVTTGPLEV